mmetsp:Transcript_87813/g.250028  ORF Transcript_87813/g.250028 Transcript_87813/m.250028 type:complete len:231 (-) Transcript_87813:891-1583(-)
MLGSNSSHCHKSSSSSPSAWGWCGSCFSIFALTLRRIDCSLWSSSTRLVINSSSVSSVESRRGLWDFAWAISASIAASSSSSSSSPSIASFGASPCSAFTRSIELGGAGDRTSTSASPVGSSFSLSSSFLRLPIPITCETLPMRFTCFPTLPIIPVIELFRSSCEWICAILSLASSLISASISSYRRPQYSPSRVWFTMERRCHDSGDCGRPGNLPAKSLSSFMTGKGEL